jgi:hypothetical protein
MNNQYLGLTFFVNVHRNILLWIKWLFRCFVFDELYLLLSVLG